MFCFVKVHFPLLFVVLLYMHTPFRLDWLECEGFKKIEIKDVRKIEYSQEFLQVGIKYM